MLKEISKTAAINDRLEKENKVMILDRPEHIEAVDAMNRKLEAARREYQIKDRKSQISAAKVVLTR